MAQKADANGMLHGTLDALILKTLTWGVAPRLRHRPLDRGDDGRRGRRRRGVALPRALSHGAPRLDRSRVGTSELGRKAKFYRVTAKGRRQLAADTAEWAKFSAGVSKVLLPSS